MTPLTPRHSKYFALMLLSFLLLSSTTSLLGFAQSSDESDWPEEFDTNNSGKTPAYFEMNKSTNPILQKYMQLEQADKAAENGQPVKPNAAPKQGGIWPFKKKQKIRPLTTEQVTRVGPRQTLSTKDPLLALPVSLELPSGGSLPSGFYLVKQEPIQDPSNDIRQLYFIRENKTLFSCNVHRTSSPTANIDSPLSITNPKLPSAVSPIMKVNISPQNANAPQTVILILQEGGDQFESEAFRIINDKRPPLRSN